MSLESQFAGAGRRVVANPASATTDAALVTAITNQRIRVCAAAAYAGTTATTVVFNTKPAGAGSAISPVFSNAINGGFVLPFFAGGWFETNVSEGLTATTGTGSATGLLVIYAVV